ncbi:related to serine/threonine protein kinase [Ramularia collo-cygni]|uniref:Serine/threonine-protein kinase RIO2 n=1 Tax=Ramularia collo-cygni TaxID=112498 RepID=A0A2D3VDL8_9PEZI|nr:related to serine/threonine protein kinase [Ramularia collo-cygni]CZT25190.1 related to serine/threonine protein kinase [Ramularia collo-cygni]
MKLDTAALRYLNNDDWRVLAAVEQGSKNHEVVPTPLIGSLSGLRGGSGVHRNISNLAKEGLIGKVKNAKYDGYRLTYGGYDYLSLNTHRRSDIIFSVGNQIGVGKEADVYITAAPDGRQLALKLHRLGRISFRTVKANRDYLRNRHAGSWMYLSRLAAQKEYAFMCVLHREGFPVPEPLAWSRHTVVMEFVDSFPLRGIESIPDPGKLYAELMDMIVQLARRGLIHGDFNEFNILIKEKTLASGKIVLQPILIDFPQTVSTNHSNAKWYFDRDVECIRRYFDRKFRYTSDEPAPSFEDATKGADPKKRLDVEVEASGFSRKMGKDLERFIEGTGNVQNEVEAAAEGQDDDDEDEEDNEDDYEDGDVEEDDGPTESHAVDAEADAQVDEGQSSVQPAEIAEEVSALSLADHPPPAPLQAANFPVDDLPRDRDPSEVAAKVRTKKKASGWAI